MRPDRLQIGVWSDVLSKQSCRPTTLADRLAVISFRYRAPYSKKTGFFYRKRPTVVRCSLRIATASQGWDAIRRSSREVTRSIRVGKERVGVEA